MINLSSIVKERLDSLLAYRIYDFCIEPNTEMHLREHIRENMSDEVLRQVIMQIRNPIVRILFKQI